MTSCRSFLMTIIFAWRPEKAGPYSCTYLQKDAPGAKPYVLLQAWNLDPEHSKATGNISFTR